MGININPSSSIGYKQSINFLGGQTSTVQTATPAKNTETKGDTVVLFGKEVNKKKAIAGGVIGAAALAGVIAAVVYAIRGGSIGAATRNAKKMANEANELAEGVKKKIDDVSQIFEKASNGSVEGVTIKEGKNGMKIMEEVVDGNVTRRTEITSGLPSKITEFLKGGKQDITTIDQGKQLSLFKGEYIKTKNGVEKWAKELESTISGTPTQYSKKVALDKDGVLTAAKRLTLQNGEAASYGEKFKKTADGVISYIKGLKFENGKPVKFVKSFDQLADGAITENGVKVFKDGKWIKQKTAA